MLLEQTAVDHQKLSNRQRPFEIAPGLDEIPAFAVIHGQIGHTLEKQQPVFDAAQIAEGFIAHDAVEIGLAHPQIKRIEMLPHFRTEQFAHVARIFAGRGDAVHNRIGILQVADEQFADIL